MTFGLISLTILLPLLIVVLQVLRALVCLLEMHKTDEVHFQQYRSKAKYEEEVKLLRDSEARNPALGQGLWQAKTVLHALYVRLIHFFS
jgi:hypothetical protein